MRRRDFLRLSALSAAAGGVLLPRHPLLADVLLRDPYASLRPFAARESRRLHNRVWRTPPVRVTGRVTARGRALANVSVSDGLTVVRTDRDGRFTLLARPELRWVRVTVPSGHTLPVSATGAAGCCRLIPSDGRADAAMTFELEPLPQSDERHAFVLLADPQTLDRRDTAQLHAETVPAVQRAIADLGGIETFGVGDGDLMFDDLTLFPEWERAAQRIGVPMVNVVGNHDLDLRVAKSNGTATATFESRFGPTYWSFDRGAVHYVVLNDVFWHGAGYLGYLDDVQAQWLAADLAHVERGRPVVVLLHIPVESTQPQREGRERRPGDAMLNPEVLYRLLEPFDAWVLSGHMHEHERFRSGGVQHVVHGAVCGAWWTGPICIDGTPNGFSLYEVNGSTIDGSYRGSGLPPEYQVRAYARGADPDAPDEIVANVWDVQPGWTVTWWEGSDRRGEMARRRGLDPLARAAMLGDTLPSRHSWAEPTPTDHLFYAPVAASSAALRVEVRTPAGATFSADVPNDADPGRR